MDMELTTMTGILILLGLLFVIATYLFIVICIALYHSIGKNDSESLKNIPQSHFKPTMTYEEINKVLNTIIMDFLEKKKKLVFDLQDIVIYDYEKEVKDLSEEVFSSLSKDFIKEYCYYHTKDYLMKRIVNTCMILLLDDLSIRKPPSKSNSTIRA